MIQYRNLLAKSDVKRPLVRPRRIVYGDIKTDLQEIGSEGTDWIDLDRDRNMCRDLVNKVMNLRVPLKAGNYFTTRRTIAFSRRTLLHAVRYTNKMT